MKVGFHPAAALELRAAASYYEDRVAGLGKEFTAEVERLRTRLAEYPALGATYARCTDVFYCDVPVRSDLSSPRI
jgi:hypothetical protein